MIEIETSVGAQLSEPKSESKMQDQSGKELTAATALTSLVTSTIKPAGEPEEQDDESINDEEANDGDTDFDIPQRYTRSGRRRAVSFPLKLMKVLSSKSHVDIIAWMPSGKSFNILDSKRFVADVLGRVFKDAKYSSFTRKLHRWGFLRHYRGEEAGAYYHENFQKGRLDLVEAMTCHKQDHVQPPVASLPLERQSEQLSTAPQPRKNNTFNAPLQRPASAFQTAMARSRLQPPISPQIDAADLSAAIEFEVARRIRENINKDALNLRAFALLREQQLIQQQRQDRHLLLQLKHQQEQRLHLLATMPSSNQNQLRWSQQGIHMLKTSIPNGKLSLAPAGNSPSDVQPFPSLPKTNITGAKTA